MRGGEVVSVEIPAPVPTTLVPEALPLPIVYQDADVVVVDKPAGMVVHPGAGHAQGTLVNALLHHVDDLSGIGGEDRPGIVHRLDRGTSGLMVVAKNDAAHRELARQFHDREVEKEYVALVWGLVHGGRRIDAPIGRDPVQREKMSARARRARSAVTRVVKAPVPGWRLASGRWHRARVARTRSACTSAPSGTRSWATRCTAACTATCRVICARCSASSGRFCTRRDLCSTIPSKAGRWNSNLRCQPTCRMCWTRWSRAMSAEMSDEHATVIDSRTIYSGRIISVTLDRVRLPHGPEASLEVVRHRGFRRAAAHDGRSDRRAGPPVPLRGGPLALGAARREASSRTRIPTPPRRANARKKSR